MINRFSVPVTLFNEFGDKCEKDLQDKSSDHLVVILAAAKISLYDGD